LAETQARGGLPSAPGRRARFGDVAALIAYAAVVLSVTFAYVSSERTFYFWDQAAYQDIAAQTASAFRESTGRGFVFLQESFAEDYNALFALPLAPWLLAFGTSRLAYELGLALCYLVPLPLALGALAVRVVPTGGRMVFWTAVGAALLVPMTWVPTLRGYPDSGAATLVVLATLVFLDDDRLEKRRTLVRLGGLLGLAVVFRRHFAYAVAAFLLSIVALSLFARRGADRSRSLTARAAGLVLRVSLVAGIALATAVVIAPRSVRRMAEHDFLALYRSYEQPLGALVTYFGGCYGWLTLLLAGAGFAAAFSTPVVRRRSAFVLTFACLSWAQWCLVVRQVGEQYTLHFTPAIVLGLVLLPLALPRRRPPGLRPLAVVLVLGSSVVNFAVGLWGPWTGVPPSVEALVAGQWPPLVRSDHAEMAELVRVLRAESGPPGGVVLVSSSPCLNASILASADRAVPGATGSLDVLPVPLVDSDGFYPLNELLAARRVLLARPFQHHLALQEQQVLRTVYDTFAAGLGIARDFTESSRVFQLEGCSVSVFERRKPTALATALAMLRAFQERVPVRPVMQPDWVVVERQYLTWLSRNPDGSTSLVAHPSPRDETPSTTFAALDRSATPVTSEGTIRFEDARCPGATLRFWAMEDGGARRLLEDVRRRPEDDGRFRVPLAPRPGERLFLSLIEYAEGAPTNFCLLTIDPFVLRHEGPPAMRR
jgi:hypothetical protein